MQNSCVRCLAPIAVGVTRRIAVFPPSPSVSAPLDPSAPRAYFPTIPRSVLACKQSGSEGTVGGEGFTHHLIVDRQA